MVITQKTQKQEDKKIVCVCVCVCVYVFVCLLFFNKGKSRNPVTSKAHYSFDY